MMATAMARRPQWPPRRGDPAIVWISGPNRVAWKRCAFFKAFVRNGKPPSCELEPAKSAPWDGRGPTGECVRVQE